MSTRGPDFLARIRFLPERRECFNADSIGVTFHALHDFRKPDGTRNDAVHVMINGERLPLGRVGETRVWLIAPEKSSGQLRVGTEFDIYSPTVLVGNGFITEIFDDELIGHDGPARKPA